MDLKAILSEVQTWPPEDRLRLIEEVWDGLADEGAEFELTDELRGLLDRRLAALEADRGDVVTWDEIKWLVEDQAEGGGYKNASEVLRAGLRLLEQQSQAEERKLAILKKLAGEGFEALDQGMGLSLDGDEQLVDAVERIGRRAARAGSGRPVE